MRQLLFAITTILYLIVLPGCGNLSPRQEQDIDNRNGKIGEIENLANSIKAEVGNLKSQNDIQNSQLDRLQQGLVNMQSNYENSGVQVLSGPGGLMIAVVAIIGLLVVSLHYRSSAITQQRTANLLAEQIARYGDPTLTEQVFQAALHSKAEENVLNLMKKHSLAAIPETSVQPVLRVMRRRKA